MTDTSHDDAGKAELDREAHLDAETIAEDAEELFEKKAEGPPAIVPDAPPAEDDASL